LIDAGKTKEEQSEDSYDERDGDEEFSIIFFSLLI